MKKWILAAVVSLLVIWNIWLSVYIHHYMPNGENGTVVVENTVNGYTTDMTDAVSSTTKSLVTVVADGREISGIIYAAADSSVYIFTDAVITSASPEVIFDSGLSMSSTLVGTDVDTSLSLLKVDVDFKVNPLPHGDSANLKPGEFCAVVGSRRMSTGKSMVTYGVVSGEEERRMTTSGMYGALVVETDAKIAGENIGGALINASGELEGMGVSHVVGGQEEMNYAVSVTEMKNVYRELTDNGSVTRGAMGITVRSIDQMESYEKSELGIDLSRNEGVIVESLYVDSPCRDVLKENDIILSVNGTEITDSGSLRSELYDLESGESVVLHIVRNGKESDVNVTLA